MNKSLFNIVLVTSLAGLSASAFAAPPLDITRASYPSASVEKASMPAAALAPRSLAPLSLLAPSAACDSRQPRKVCEVRLAAQRRATEVIAEEVLERHAAASPLPMSGLLIPVAQPVCDPRMTPAECERVLRGAPPGALPPMRIPPRISPTPPTPPVRPVIPQSAPVPEEAPTPPIAADPEAVIAPPRTGDGEIIVQPPPPSASKMPVIKPKPESPVIPKAD